TRSSTSRARSVGTGASLILPAGVIPRIVPLGVAVPGGTGFLVSEVVLEADGCTPDPEIAAAAACIGTPMLTRLNIMRHWHAIVVFMRCLRVRVSSSP